MTRSTLLAAGAYHTTAALLPVLLVWLVWSLVGCAPDTDLTNEPPRGGSSAGPLAPAGVLLVEPAAGSSDVPPNLAAVVVRFAAPVAMAPGSVALCRTAGGGDLPSSSAEAVPCPGPGWCYRLPIEGALPSGATCVVAVRPGLMQEDGAGVPAGVVGQFDTAVTQDGEPPRISALTVQPGGACLSVHFVTDEITSAAVVLAAAGQETVISAGAGTMTFELSINLRPLPPDSDATLVVRVVDRAGNPAQTSSVPIRTPPVLPPLVITEILANPAGKEPDQEYVELRNTGTEPIDLGGLRLEDSRGGDVLPQAILAPGAYALVVAAPWDPSGAQDTPPRPSTTVVRVDARLGSDGLSNAGEAVRLRAAAPAMQATQGMEAPVISSYGGWIDTSAASWSGRSIHRLSDLGCDHPSGWNRTPLEATPGGGPP